MVLKAVNWVHNDEIRLIWFLKGVNWVHNDQKLGQMVLKGVNLDSQ